MGKASKKKRALTNGSGRREIGADKGVTQETEEDFQRSDVKAILLLPMVIIVAVSFALYFNTLFNDFVYDDMTQVLENRWIRDVRNLPDIFSKSVWSFWHERTTSNFYRPLMHIIYMFNYYVFGLKPWGFHLVNVLFHAANSVLVFLIAVRLVGASQVRNENGSFVIPARPGSFFKRDSRPGGSPGVTGQARMTQGQAGMTAAIFSSLFTSHDSRFFAFIAALLFAVHPIHTEAVAWVAGLPDLSFTFFYLLSLHFYMRLGTDATKYAYLLSVAAFPFALLCKEPALTLPVILFAYDYFLVKSDETSLDRIKRYIPYLAVSCIYLLLRLNALKSFVPVRSYAELSAYQYIINVFPLFMQYIEKLILPVNLNLWHVFRPAASVFEANWIMSFAVTTAFVAFCFFAFKKNKAALFALLLIIIPLLPAFYIPGISGKPFAERYLYLPSFGFITVLTLLVMKLRLKLPKGGSVITAAVIVLAVLYSAGTVTRNYIWKNNYSLFSDTVRKSPDISVVHLELGTAELERGNIEGAVAHFDKAISLDPSDWHSYNNRGMAFYKRGRPDEAVADFDKAIVLNPRCYEAYNNKGQVYGQTGSFDKAIEQFGKAIEIRPDPLAYVNRSLAYFLIGNYGTALEDLNSALALDRDSAEAYGARGNIYLRTGNKELAVADFRKACDLGDRKGCDVLKLYVK